jgi:hypothetical protein
MMNLSVINEELNPQKKYFQQGGTPPVVAHRCCRVEIIGGLQINVIYD